MSVSMIRLPFLLIALALIAIVLLCVGQRHPTLATTTRQAAIQPNPIQVENGLPGSDGWRLTEVATNHQIEGYASAVSIPHGSTLDVAVSTSAPSYGVKVFRMGWYGGAGGRLVDTLDNLPGTLQPVPPPDPQTGLIECHWTVSFTLPVPDSWVSGIYLLVLTASTGYQAYVPLVVTDPASRDTYAFIHGVATDQAYNAWGGKSLYGDSSYSDPQDRYARRARMVSFDRPFEQANGAGNFFYWEYPMIRWLERNGYDVTYLSDIDLDEQPALTLAHRGILIVGHDEYWSRSMRDGLASAVQNGVNLGLFAADTGAWQVRFQPDNSGGMDRTEVCYKSAAEDPLSTIEPKLTTVNWQSPPVSEPESTLVGATFAGILSSKNQPLVVNDAGLWIFQGTGLKDGDSIAAMVGYEYDAVKAYRPHPPDLQIPFSSPVLNTAGRSDVAQSSLYTAASGATVFNAGTLSWALRLDQYTAAGDGWDEDLQLEQITTNIMGRLGPPDPRPTPTATPTITATPLPSDTPTPSSTPTDTPRPTATLSPTSRPTTTVVIDKVLILRRVRGENVSTHQIVHLGQWTDFYVLYHSEHIARLQLHASLTVTRKGKVVAEPPLGPTRLGTHTAFRTQIIFRNAADLGRLYAHLRLSVGALVVKRDRRFYLVR
jgi:hypothetical protein